MTECEVASSGVISITWGVLYADSPIPIYLIKFARKGNTTETQATQLIRARTLSPVALRIVAMTAAVMPEDIETSLAAGMDAYLSKPIQIEALTDQLKICHEVIRQQRGE